MGVGDDGGNVVKRNPAQLHAFRFHRQKSPLLGQVAAILGDFHDAGRHYWSFTSLTRPIGSTRTHRAPAS